MISAIVPVYNAAATLRRCAMSVLAQGVEDLELILVDDGSTDESPALCAELARQDARVRVISQINLGVHAARGAGLDAARGEWILFADADDMLEPDACRLSLEAAAGADADIVFWAYWRDGANGSVLRAPFGEDRVFRGEELRALRRRIVAPIGGELAHPEDLDLLCPVWGKMYRRGVIAGSRFADAKEIGSCEDGLFNLEVFGRARCAVYLHRPLYRYARMAAPSMTTSFDPALPAKWRELYRRMGAIIAKEDLGADFAEALRNREALSLIGLGMRLIYAGAPSRERRGQLREALRSPGYRRAVAALDTGFLPPHWRVFFLCARLGSVGGVWALLRVMRRLAGR